MDNSKRDTSNYVRSTYRRSGSKRPDYGRSKSQGQVWSIIIVLLLIVILAGGAVWIYLSRQGEGPEVASQETEALVPPATAEAEPGAETTELARADRADTESEALAPQATETETETPSPDVNAEEDRAAASEGASQGQNAEDEFAAILRELGINDSGEAGQEEEAAGAEMERGTPENVPQEEQPEMLAQEKTEKAAGLQQEQAGATVSAPVAQEMGVPEAEVPPARAFVPDSGVETPEAEIPPAAASFPEDTTPSFEETAPQVPLTVVVQSGDSLSRIAERVYGDPGKWRLIYEANQDILESPDRVLVGMTLTIPPEE